MHSEHNNRICIYPPLTGIGGMVSFYNKLVSGLQSRGFTVIHELDKLDFDALLVIGGTRQLLGLWKVHRCNIPIVQRLDGLNWIHRVRPTNIRYYLRAELGNILLKVIRNRLASIIVYQSKFAHQWWESTYGKTPVPWKVVYNGVDLNMFTPSGSFERPTDKIRILLVEGSFQGGYEFGVNNAIRLAEHVSRLLQNSSTPNGLTAVELMIVGRVSLEAQKKLSKSTQVPIKWTGILPHDKVPEICRSAHIFFSADINAACPNSVIEAMACGTPVVTFATGALPEIVTDNTGKLVAYGGDPWKLNQADIPALAREVINILAQWEQYSVSSRQRAEALFGLDTMIDGYLEALLGG